MLTSSLLSKRLLRSAVTQIAPSRSGSTHNWFPRKPGQKRPRVQDHIIWLNYVSTDGQLHRVPGWPDQTILQVLKDYSVPNLGFDLCFGADPNFKPSDVPVDWYSEGPACGQCQIVIPKQWNEKIYFGEKEKECIMADASEPIFLSRLACCITLRPSMNEMVIYAADNNDESFY